MKVVLGVNQLLRRPCNRILTNLTVVYSYDYCPSRHYKIGFWTVRAFLQKATLDVIQAATNHSKRHRADCKSFSVASFLFLDLSCQLGISSAEATRRCPGTKFRRLADLDAHVAATTNQQTTRWKLLSTSTASEI